MTTLIAPTDMPHRDPWWAALRRRIVGSPRRTAQAREVDARAMLARAQAYEATQPGYAADLREAARALQRSR